MQRSEPALATIAFLALVGLAVSAQTPGSSATINPRQAIPTYGFVPAVTVVSTKPHAPFSATVLEQMEQTLNDGTTIARDNEEVVMRDSAGRVYRARKIRTAVYSDTDPRIIITIIDPILRVQYLCSPVKICRKLEYRSPHNVRRPVGVSRGKDPNVTIEDLGPSEISGVEVNGKRITRVIPEGAAGNDRPFTTVQEIWHSAELDVDVQLKRSDPRAGTRTTTMTQLNLTEPDPKYFQIPDGYQVYQVTPPLGAPFPMAPTPGEPLPPMPPAQ